MTTLTADAAQAGFSPREAADGVTVVVASFTWAATPSAGEVINMIKIPANATLLDLKIGGSFPGADAAGPSVQIGTNGLSGSTSPSYITGAFALSTSTVLITPTIKASAAGGALPLYCGVSDDNAQQYVIITAGTTAAGSGSAGSVLRMIATYGRRGTAGVV